MNNVTPIGQRGIPIIGSDPTMQLDEEARRKVAAHQRAMGRQALDEAHLVIARYGTDEDLEYFNLPRMPKRPDIRQLDKARAKLAVTD